MARIPAAALAILLASVLAVSVPGSIAHGQAPTQSFQEMNIADETISQAEIETAESEFSNPGALPGEPFYFFKRLGEGIQIFFSFSQEGKARLHLKFAKARLAEAKMLSERNMTKRAEGAIEEFSRELDSAGKASAGIGRNVSSLLKETGDILGKSSLVLALILEKAPEGSKPAIKRALDNSVEMKIRLAEKKQEAAENEVRKEVERIQQAINAAEEKPPKQKPVICIQVITPARNPETGECREFPTPCDVPEGWEKTGSCPA